MSNFSERDVDNLSAVLDHCDRVIAIADNYERSYEAFKSDVAFRDAVLMNIFQIGEAVNRLSDECKEQLSELPWHQMYGMRNRIAHGYGELKDEIIWDAALNSVPDLKEKLEELI